MQEASDAHSKTADSDTVSTYQVSSVQLVTDKNMFVLEICFLLVSLQYFLICRIVTTNNQKGAFLVVYRFQID